MLFDSREVKLTISNSQSVSKFEKRSFIIARWANLVMAIAGVGTSWLSHADALMVDGLYSGVNFLSSLVAAKVGEAVMRPSSKARPFGYFVDEAIYISFRSMILLGILIFACVSAISRILAYIRGNEAPELIFGFIVVYSVAMASICLGLAYSHHRNWLNSGKVSDILKTEKQAAIIDASISGGLGVAYALAPLLSGTFLKFLLPVTDSVVVLVLAMIMIKDPIKLFLDALSEIAGKGAKPAIVAAIQDGIAESADLAKYQIVDIAASKVGRFYLAIIYLNPSYRVSAQEVDQLCLAIKEACIKRIGLIEIELVLTENQRLME